MSQLIGNTPEVDVLCKAQLLDGGKKTTVPFNVIFARQSRTENKALKKRIQDYMNELRALAKELLIIDQDSACQSDDGKVILADARYLKTLGEEEEPQYLTSDEKTERRNAIDISIETIEAKFDAEIRGSVKDIKNLKGSDKKTFTFCAELLEDMLNNEAYFNALREGLFKSTGAFEEKRTKNS